MSRQIVSTNIRFNLEKEKDWTAWEYLQRRDKREHRSYSRAVIAAVNDYFESRGRLASDPYLEGYGEVLAKRFFFHDLLPGTQVT